MQLAVIVAAARLLGALARWVGQPAVVGEIVAGLVLGPSLLGWLAPGLFAAVFRPTVPGLDVALTDAVLAKVFGVIAQLGLVFLMFLVGLELEWSHLRGRLRTVLAVAVAGIAVPFAFGSVLTPLILSRLGTSGGSDAATGTRLFLALTFAVTAIPVLGRILTDLGITRTRIGTVTLAAAGVSDALCWILLAGIGSAVRSSFDMVPMLRMGGWAIGFVLLMALVLRPLLVRYFAAAVRNRGTALGLTPLTVLFVALFLAAMATNRIGIVSVFGAFLLGAILADQDELRDAVSARLADVVNGFFVPVFFTYTGLRTDLTSLGGPGLWLTAGVVVLTAVASKLLGCGLAAWASGFTWREAGIVGAMMSARGLMALVAISLGYELGVIPPTLYAVLVLMAVATTAFTTPLLLVRSRGTEIEEPIRASGLLH